MEEKLMKIILNNEEKDFLIQYPQYKKELETIKLAYTMAMIRIEIIRQDINWLADLTGKDRLSIARQQEKNKNSFEVPIWYFFARNNTHAERYYITWDAKKWIKVLKQFDFL